MSELTIFIFGTIVFSIFAAGVYSFLRVQFDHLGDELNIQQDLNLNSVHNLRYARVKRNSQGHSSYTRNPNDFVDQQYN